MADDWLYQLAYGLTRVLIITVSVDHYIRTVFQRIVHTITERTGQSHRSCMMHKMPDAETAGYLHRLIGTAIIDDKQLNVINAGNLSWHLLQDHRQCLFLIKAWNLDKKTHSNLTAINFNYMMICLDFTHHRRPVVQSKGLRHDLQML